jgi:hypothetical protein
MKKREKKDEEKESKRSGDFTSPETDTDKTGIDLDSDKTVKKKSEQKSKLEVDPDSTEIDTDADKTKKKPNNLCQRGKGKISLFIYNYFCSVITIVCFINNCNKINTVI